MNIVQIKELLQKRKLKATSTRLNLLSIMRDQGSAMSHSAIQEKMNPIDRVTLYRTIEKLKEKGIIHKVFQENNQTYYAICGITCDENHHLHEHIHFKCLSCNTITCEDLPSNVNIALPNYLIQKVSINIEGTCEKCT